MEANNLRYHLFDKIISIQDNSVLQKIEDLIGSIDLEKTKIKLTDAQRQMLISSEEDIRKGKTVTDEDLNEEENKWLNK